MKRTILYWLAGVLLIAACKKTTDVPNEGTFTAMTYNVAGLPEPISASHPATNTPFISQRINKYDIVNVQEDFFYDSLLRKFQYHPYQTKWEAKTSLGDGLNIFSRFLILDFMRSQWNDCNGTDCFTPKGFAYSRVKLNDKAYIDLYDLHCNAGSEPLDLAARRKNILQLCKYVKFKSAGNAVIIMGDTNTRYTREGDNTREILALGFKDAWIELEKGGVLPDQNGVSLPDEVVDKIFYRSNSHIELTALDYQIPESEFLDAHGEWLSDHRPVFVKFQFKVLN